MIKVSNKDSIIDIIKKIESSKKNEIVLEFSLGNSILHNYTSLKILKNKAKNKELIIVTSDLSAKKIGKELGIKFSIVKNEKAIKNIDLLKYNYTFFEYLKFLIKSYFQEFKNLFQKNKKGKFIQEKYNNFLNYKNIKNEKGRVGFFISWLSISICLLLFIFYFAVHKTYITISSEVVIKTRAKNLTFQENQETTLLENKNIIKLKEVSLSVYLNDTFGTSGIYEETLSRSKGEVTLLNHLKEKVTLVENTRLQTASGFIYTIPEKITLPAGRNNTICSNEKCKSTIPGTTDILVTAKTYGTNGSIIGEGGNIGSGTTLFFPGLGENLKDTIYGIAKTNFIGGEDGYEKIVAKDDIENAKKILEEKLKAKALVTLKEKIKEENSINNTNYEIPGIDKIIDYSELQITGDEDIKPGDKEEKILLSGTIKVKTYIYNKDSVINKLKSTIRESILSDVEKINFINDDSLRISNVISRKEDPTSIKITAEIDVFYTHNFLSKTSNYLEKLKNTISGMDTNEARKILINNQKISDVTIETRPFFIKKISKIPKNIIFKIDN